MALFGFNLSGLASSLQTIFGAVSQVFAKFKEAVSHLLTLRDRLLKFKESVVGEIDGWKNFKQDIRLKQRVIQLESAVSKTKDLISGIPTAWHSIVDIIQQFKAQIGEENPTAAADEAAAAFEEGGGLQALTKIAPRLAKGAEKALLVLGLIAGAIEAASNIVDDAQQVVDELKGLRLEFEKLDSIFLSQSNKRKTLKLQDGSSIRIRVGKLHPS